MHGEQLRAARALVRWTLKELAEKCISEPVSVDTLKKWEATNGPIRGLAPKIDAARKALESAGVEFIPENGGGPGVRLKRLGTDQA